MDEHDLRNLYITKGMSMSEIARSYGYSVHKIEYWMSKYLIARRSRADAQSMKKHGIGHGFTIKHNLNAEEYKLFGLGVGLYWGEGNKRNRHTVRLGNTDPGIITTFTSSWSRSAASLGRQYDIVCRFLPILMKKRP